MRMINQLLKLIPKAMRRKMHSAFRSKILDDVQKASSKIPAVEFEPKHLQHAKLVTDRYALLDLLPKNAVIAEIGVDEGHYSKHILDQCKPAKLHLIDTWASKRYSATKKNLVNRKFESQISSGQIEMNLGISHELANQFPDHYFDWIYIDTNHSFETTLKELNSYAQKLKPNGMIAGHDFVKGNWKEMYAYGVREAVAQFCKKNDWTLIYLTAEIGEHPSFVIKRIIES